MVNDYGGGWAASDIEGLKRAGLWTGTKKPTVKPAAKPVTTPTPSTTYYTPPSGGKGVGTTGVTGGTSGSYGGWTGGGGAARASGVGSAPAEVAVLPSWGPEITQTPPQHVNSAPTVSAPAQQETWTPDPSKPYDLPPLHLRTPEAMEARSNMMLAQEGYFADKRNARQRDIDLAGHWTAANAGVSNPEFVPPGKSQYPSFSQWYGSSDLPQAIRSAPDQIGELRDYNIQSQKQHEVAPPPVRYEAPRPADWNQQPQQQQPQQSMAQQYGWGNMAGGGAPQGMAQQYGWGSGLGGQPQQQMPQWGQPPQQQMQMPQWGGQPQGMGGMQWGGAPQQQAMPQWGQMMQQRPMGGPMAGMEAARMGGGAMQQMGGGSPWASMWGNPFAGRQMTTDPNSPAMGGLPQMDPTQQLMMQMMGGGGGLSGGFGEGGGSSGGGGMSGAGQTGGGADYDGLANILALFAGSGYGGGGGGAGASYNPMYGGLPRNGLFYADLMGAGG